jgi:hypothetical protein
LENASTREYFSVVAGSSTKRSIPMSNPNETFEVTELDDKDLDDVAGGLADNTNCSCNGNCGCGSEQEDRIVAQR